MIITTDGGKGGVGKTIVAMLTLHFFIRQGQKPVLIETDDSNQEVFRSYRDKNCLAHACDINSDTGFGEMLGIVQDTLDKDSDTPIIINQGARNRGIINEFGQFFDSLPDLITLWVVDEQPDGLIALKEYLQTVSQKICIVKNGGVHKKRESDFSAFHDSKMAAAGMPSVFLGTAPAMTADALFRGRKAVHELKDHLATGHRMMAEAWVKASMTMLEQAFEKAAIFDLGRLK